MTSLFVTASGEWQLYQSIKTEGYSPELYHPL